MHRRHFIATLATTATLPTQEIGRASCRERVSVLV